ncbi:hypothetical protein K4A95_005265 [Escherichia coli]|nr:hypothetical protein [Escherichia coli]
MQRSSSLMIAMLESSWKGLSIEKIARLGFLPSGFLGFRAEPTSISITFSSSASALLDKSQKGSTAQFLMFRT